MYVCAHILGRLKGMDSRKAGTPSANETSGLGDIVIASLTA